MALAGAEKVAQNHADLALLTGEDPSSERQIEPIGPTNDATVSVRCGAGQVAHEVPIARTRRNVRYGA
jgi:hypothetical protein